MADSKEIKKGIDNASEELKKKVDEYDGVKDKAKERIEEVEEKVRTTVHNVAEKVNQKIESLDVESATRKAEDEVHKLREELADLKRKAGPKIQEAENFLTSPSAITFYKGLITGVAIVFVYNKVIQNRL